MLYSHKIWSRVIDGKVPDMLAWLLHDYWLHYTYLGDKESLRDGLFPILRKTGNSYLNYLKDNL